MIFLGNNTENANLIGLKTEEGIEGSKLPQDAFSNMGCSGGVPGPIPSHPPPPDGVQPLASNIVNKQSSVEVQYMQQQSQIFVFSTQLANKGAEAVFQGQYPSIIAYHCAQPGTKKYLEVSIDDSKTFKIEYQLMIFNLKIRCCFIVLSVNVVVFLEKSIKNYTV